MNGAIEKAFAGLVRVAVLPEGVTNEGQRVVPAEWQIEPNTGGNVLESEKDWIVCKVEQNDRVAGKLWRGTFSFHVLTRALTDPPDPAPHLAALRNLRVWLQATPAATLKAAFDEACADCTLGGTFVAASPDPEQNEMRWRSELRLTCGWVEK